MRYEYKMHSINTMFISKDYVLCVSVLIFARAKLLFLH